MPFLCALTGDSPTNLRPIEITRTRSPKAAPAAYGISAHEKVRCQERVLSDGAPGQRLASIAGGVKVERPERAVAREDERP